MIPLSQHPFEGIFLSSWFTDAETESGQGHWTREGDVDMQYRSIHQGQALHWFTSWLLRTSIEDKVVHWAYCPCLSSYLYGMETKWVHSKDYVKFTLTWRIQAMAHYQMSGKAQWMDNCNIWFSNITRIINSVYQTLSTHYPLWARTELSIGRANAKAVVPSSAVCCPGRGYPLLRTKALCVRDPGSNPGSITRQMLWSLEICLIFHNLSFLNCKTGMIGIPASNVSIRIPW